MFFGVDGVVCIGHFWVEVSFRILAFSLFFLQRKKQVLNPRADQDIRCEPL